MRLLTPTFAPSSDGGTAPPSGTPDGQTPPAETPPAGAPDPSSSIPEGQSPPVEEPKPEPTAEEQAAAALEAARAAVHADAAQYAINLPDDAKAALRLADADDPIVSGLQQHFAEAGKSQGALDDFLATAGELAKAGLFDTGFDVAAETAKLGENAEGRRREVEIFAEALKSRGDGFDEEMHGELMSLSPSAAGVKLIEYMRKAMGPAGVVDPPADGGEKGGNAKLAEAQAMRRDPRYETDRTFRKQADAAWMAAFS